MTQLTQRSAVAGTCRGLCLVVWVLLFGFVVTPAVASQDGVTPAGPKKVAQTGEKVEVPLDISGRLSLEMPGRLRLSTSLDTIYRSYVFSPTLSTALGFRFF